VQALPLQADSVLLRHEAAYVLGQCGEGSPVAAKAQLLETLRNEAEDDIVRHEAVEALAALSDVDALEEIERLSGQSISEPLRHTCELASASLRRKQAAVHGELVLPVCGCQYTSRDPGEGKPGATQADVPAAKDVLMDVSLPLYDRYEGLFTLRNVGGAVPAEALAGALRLDASSAVLRHEIAFVLAQMEEESATAALAASLADCAEHGMVRHEAAIALGAIGTDDAEAALRSFEGDADKLVAESCQVALATSAYWRVWEELEARVAAGA